MEQTLIVGVIDQTEFAEHLDAVINQARHGRTILVQEQGENQVAIMSTLDFYLLRAMAAYRARQPAPINDSTMAPRGLALSEIKPFTTSDESAVRGRWETVIAAYLDGDISLGRAATLLGISRFELINCFNRLELPLHLGSMQIAEARAELQVLQSA